MSNIVHTLAGEKSTIAPNSAQTAKPAQSTFEPGLEPAAFSAPAGSEHLPSHSLSRFSVHYGSALPVQTKLTVGPVNDHYEQEADHVAQRVVEQINNPAAQRQEVPEEEETLQAKPVSGSLQRQETPSDEEEPLQTKPLIASLQRQEVPEEEEQTLQAKPLSGLLQRQETPSDEEEPLQTKPLITSIQRQEMPEEKEDTVQTKLIQRQESMQEDEDQLQAKSQLQRRSDGSMAAKPQLESAIEQSRGSGHALPDSTRHSMEQAFGSDFSGVRIHTDTQADQLNQSIQARAFTTGQDIYFRQGEHSPGTRAGQELLAHELTHVVQQSGTRVQRKYHTISKLPGSISKKSLLSNTDNRTSKMFRENKIGLPGLIQSKSIVSSDKIIQRALLYRGMQASESAKLSPLLGNDAGYQLGVRDNEVKVENGQALPQTGGMSTSNTSAAVPAFTVSKSYVGGTHNTIDQNKQEFRWKWKFDDANLPGELTTRNDHDNHVMIEPKDKLLLSRFRELVQSTQANWERTSPP